MKVFVSWSGETSGKLAELLRDWLPKVIQSLSPFLSKEIDKGSRWPQILAQELNDTSFGISVITPDNTAAPWLLFEAGAISKAVDASSLAPLLFGITKDRLGGSPLSQFQMTDFGREEMLQLLQSVNNANGSNKLPEERVSEAFDKFWPEFEGAAREHIDSLNQRSPSSADAPEAQAAANPTRDASEDNASRSQRVDIRSTTDPKAFEAELPDFLLSDVYKSDPEYWDPTIAYHRHRLGLSSSGMDLKTLAAKHPNWSWPNYYLALELSNSGDFSAASEKLNQIGKVEREDMKRFAPQLSIDVAHGADGFGGGLAAIRKLISEGVEEPFIAAAIERLCSKTIGPEARLVSLMLRELGVRYNPANVNLRFNLAHALAGVRGADAVAFHHYAQIEHAPEQKVNTSNNMAVICTTRALPTLAADYYQNAITMNNVLSRANLANLFTGSGFLKQADETLAPISDSGGYKTQVAAARSKLEIAREKRDTDRAALLGTSKQEHERFARFVSRCSTQWLSDSRKPADGLWASADGRLVVSIAEGKYTVEFKAGAKVAKGELASNGLCMEGLLLEPGMSAQSAGTRQLMLCYDSEKGEAYGLTWGGLPLPASLCEFVLAPQLEPAAQSDKT